MNKVFNLPVRMDTTESEYQLRDSYNGIVIYDIVTPEITEAIVTAVNNHDKLVAALREISEYCIEPSDVEVADKALKEAGYEV